MNNRYKSVKKASILGIIGNIFLLIIKSTIGIISNSQAMLADALNSAGDIFSSIMTFIGNKIASIPKDEDHNLGHGKAEYIYSMLISIAMILMSLKSLIDSILSLFIPEKYTFTIWLIIVCIATIIIKFLLYKYTYKLSQKYNNLLIKANSIDHRNDCIITLFNLIACLFSLYNIYFIDSIVGSCISIWLIISATKIFKESYDVLMDKSINEETKIKVYKIIERHKEIQKVSNFNSTPIGYLYQVSLIIYVDGNLTTFASHKIADKIEREITKEIEEIYIAVIHVNPIKINKKL